MSTDLLDHQDTQRPEGYPFHIGYRNVRRIDANGHETWEEIPLTEEDFLHPQEEDRFMVSLGHVDALYQLVSAIRLGGPPAPEIGVFADMRIDWQVPGIRPHGPDVIVFDHEPAGLPSDTGTLHVEDLGLKPLILFKVTSPSTRHIDFGAKFDHFLQLGIPVYVVIDLASPAGEPRIIAFEHCGDRYREMPLDERLGLYIPALGLWFRLDKGWLKVADKSGQDLPDLKSLSAAWRDAEAARQRAEAEQHRAREAMQTADAERQRAEAERLQAEAEKQRAAEAIAAAAAERQRAENEAQRAESERQRAESERQRAENEAQRASEAEMAAAAEKARADELALELAKLKARFNASG